MLLEGGIQYYEPIRTRQYKQGLGDKVRNFLIPSNLKWLMDGLTGNNYLHTEKDLRQIDIKNLKKAYLHSKARENEIAKDLVNALAQRGIKTTIDNELDKDGRRILYGDYDMRRKYYLGLFNNPTDLIFDAKKLSNIIDDSFKSPGFRMSSTVGKANYGTNKNGDVYVYDTYQFNPNFKVGNYKNGVMGFIRNNIAPKTKSYPVEINLGNPKYWDIDF